MLKRQQQERELCGLTSPEPGRQLLRGKVRDPAPEHCGRAALEGVGAELDLELHDAPEVEQDAAGAVQARGVLPAPLIVLREEGHTTEGEREGGGEAQQGMALGLGKAG